MNEKIIQYGLRTSLIILVTGIFIAGCVCNSSFNSQNSEERNGTIAGKLTGMVTISPISPVERNDTPAYSIPAVGVRLIISTTEGQDIISAVTDDNGRYCATLLPGRYQVNLSIPFKGYTKNLPATITITENKETPLDIRIDTGIR